MSSQIVPFCLVDLLNRAGAESHQESLLSYGVYTVHAVLVNQWLVNGTSACRLCYFFRSPIGVALAIGISGSTCLPAKGSFASGGSWYLAQVVAANWFPHAQLYVMTLVRIFFFVFHVCHHLLLFKMCWTLNVG